jgi:hypothetical protein
LRLASSASIARPCTFFHPDQVALYTAPDIAEVFCPEKPTFALSEIDQGRLISVKIPQKYQVEKKYIGLLLKTLFYLHAL